MLNKKTIKFHAAAEDLYKVEQPPIPAKLAIPEWFKKIPAEDPALKWGDPRDASTVKKCIPFLDALTAGYMIVTPQDIKISKTETNGTMAYWGAKPPGGDILFDLDQPLHRTKGMPVPSGYNEYVWRMMAYPRIETPDGYSIMVTHPFNRYELPFLTMTAVIDSDKVQSRLALNMWLKDDFEGIIEKGTPVAQIFPFKRENWVHESLPPFPFKRELQENFKIRSVMNRSYMRQFWQKKSYE
jgi:hypothetical protein